MLCWLFRKVFPCTGRLLGVDNHVHVAVAKMSLLENPSEFIETWVDAAGVRIGISEQQGKAKEQEVSGGGKLLTRCCKGGMGGLVVLGST